MASISFGFCYSNSYDVLFRRASHPGFLNNANISTVPHHLQKKRHHVISYLRKSSYLALFSLLRHPLLQSRVAQSKFGAHTTRSANTFPSVHSDCAPIVRTTQEARLISDALGPYSLDYIRCETRHARCKVDELFESLEAFGLGSGGGGLGRIFVRTRIPEMFQRSADKTEASSLATL